MRASRKERRKPELQIYRPGQGLQNKNQKVEKKITSDNGNSNQLQVINGPDPHKTALDKTSKTSDKSNKASKHAKSRRPDIQVYTPKPKASAKLNDKIPTDSSPSKWEEEIDTSWKKSSAHCDRLNSSEVKSDKPNLTQMKSDKNVSSKKEVSDVQSITKEINISSYKGIKSWADCMDESDASNSRISPEEKQFNGHVDDNVHLHLSTSNTSNLKCDKNLSVNQMGNKDDQKRQRNKRHNRNCDDHVEIPKEKQHNTSRYEIVNVQKSREEQPRRKGRTVSESSLPNEKKCYTNSLDRNKSKYRDDRPTAASTDMKRNSPEINSTGNNVFSNEPKSDRRKKESSLPPRFQKQKGLIADLNNPGQCRGGGILKIPHDIDASVETLEKFSIPKVFPEPPPQFIHKQLFDPNNPSKPEIINIPAPVPPPHMPYGNMNPVYFPTDSLTSPYISAPVDNNVYISPPQPPTTNPQFRYLQPDIRTESYPNGYLDNSASAIPQINGLFSSPSHGYNDMNPSHGKRSEHITSRDPVEFDYVSYYIDKTTPDYPIDDLIAYDYSKKRLKPIVEKNLHEIVLLEKEMASALSKGLLGNNLNSVKQCRWKLQLRYENIILADPKYCAEKNPEQSLWKTVYHQIIELFRKKLEENPHDSEEIKETLFNVILEGSMFYENLLEKQQETYGFKLTKLLETEHVNTSGFNDQLRVVLISVQKNIIYLGDLARYKEQISGTSNYGKARSWYLKAQLIAPKNGKPYHQLALLAFNTKRKLDAVYYYMRSLAASNPFLSAKESLLTLFEEAKRKYEVYEKKRACESSVETEILEDRATERCEFWIKNDGSSSERPADVEKNVDGCDLKKLSDVELNKRFVTSFLHVHGKLFTKVGMETFPDALNNMLKEFYFLLQRSPIPLTSSRLLQLSAINIFSVTNSSLKENGREQGGRSLLQEQALYTSMAMMSLIMDRCCLLHIAHKASPEYSTQIISEDFAHLLPSVKIWTDWMSCQKCLWPPPSIQLLERLNTHLSYNIWASFAEFLSVLQEIDVSTPVIIHQRAANCEPILLEEDSSFAGFVPLLGAIQNPAYTMIPFDKDRAKHCLRISKIQFFGDYLCGITPPYLEFNVESKRFISVINCLSFEESFERSVLLSSEDSYREDNLDDELCDDVSNRSSLSNEFQVLKSRREALSKAREQQQKYQAQVQAVLQKHQSQRPIVLKIKPRYLVPDTNCFIDHLKLFKNILASTDFHLIIPLVVINELDGLARGTKVNGRISPDHASRVTALSREAILFLEQQFASRHPHLRSITSKGSILDTISFRSEEMGQNKGTNDDLILTCCLNYCKDRAENFMPKHKDDPITLFREVVLLTDDRNLRVKALAHHVPVRDLLSFLQWVNS